MLPILTLQNLLQYNNTLFDDITLPDGAVRDLLVQQIVAQYGDMQPICPDWPALKYYVNSWFGAHQQQLQHLWNDYIATYNPVYNRDGYVEEIRSPNLVHTDKERSDASVTGESSASGTSSSTGSNSSSGTGSSTRIEYGSTTSKYQGFQSTAFQDVSKTVPENTATDNALSSSDESSSATGYNTQTGSSESHTSTTGQKEHTETGHERIERHEYGNVGLTMASQMLRDDTAFWHGFSWYSMAARLWAVDNLVMVY